MESIIKDHILNHLSINNLLSPYQFGFIPGRSCSTQLLLILDYLTHHLDNGYSIDVIYLDFQKAFDTVLHQRLLQKLTSFGIHGNVLKWIENFYLTEGNKLYLMAISQVLFQLLVVFPKALCWVPYYLPCLSTICDWIYKNRSKSHIW